METQLTITLPKEDWVAIKLHVYIALKMENSRNYVPIRERNVAQAFYENIDKALKTVEESE